MTHASCRGAITRQTAMLLGIGSSLAIVGVIVFVSLWRGSGGQGAGAGAGLPRGDGNSTGPESTASSAPPTDVTQVGRTGRAFNEFLEKETGRIKQHVGWREMNPLPRGQFEVVQPRAWLYTKDGQTLEVQAASGRIRFSPESKQKRPESGEFDGGVLIRMYAKGVLDAQAVRSAMSGAGAGGSGENGLAWDRVLTRSAPTLVGYAESLTFDTLTNEYSTTQRVMISTGELESEFAGLRVVYNEVEARPDLVESSGGFVRLTKKPKPVSGEEGAAGAETVGAEATMSEERPQAESGAASAAAAGAGTIAAPNVQYYRTDFSDTVELGAKGQAITADKLLVWMRLVDGKLRDTPAADGGAGERGSGTGSEAKPETVKQPNEAGDAQNPTSPGASGGAKQPVVSMNHRVAGLRGMPASAPKPIAGVREDDVLLTWRGAVSVYAMEEEPKELAADEAAARFVAEGSQAVMLRDTRSAEAPFAMCGVLDYGVTSKTASLSGAGARSVVMVDPKHRRHGAVDRFTINLQTGIAQAVGSGVLSAVKNESLTTIERGDPAALINRLRTIGEEDSALAWTDQADFVFMLDAGRESNAGGIEARDVGDAGITSIREAMFSGNVIARQERSLVSGEFLRATFAPARSGDAPGTETNTMFTRVLVEGRAHGETLDAKKPLERKSLDADRFDIAFTPDGRGKGSDPSVLTATGNVRGEQVEERTTKDEAGVERHELQTTKLGTGLLEAQLQTVLNEKGRKRTDVVVAVASEGVRFERSDGIGAVSERMRADLLTKDADFTGPEVVLTRGPSSVRGTDIGLNGSDNSIEVRSAGNVAHSDAASVAAGAEKGLGAINLVWTGLMRFNDSTGAGESVGATRLTHEPDRLNRTTIDAERVGVQMEPAGEYKQREEEAKQAGRKPPERQVRQATATGTGSTPQTRAKAESREYAADAGAENGRRLQRLTYLEAQTIIADEQQGVFDVPASGRALILDHRVVANERSDSSIIPTSNPQGTTLLGWSGSLRYARATGLIEMESGAELTHKPLDTSKQPLKIVADRMEGHLRAKDGASGEAGNSLSGLEQEQLVRAIAIGNVVVTSLNDDMRLSAARVEFDADARVLTASAGTQPGETVEYIDAKRGTPVVAKRLIVRLKENDQHEIEVVEPMPITAPIPR